MSKGSKVDVLEVDFDAVADALLCEQEFDSEGRGYWECPGLDDARPSNEGGHEERHPAKMVDANLISSLCRDGLHRPVIDLDVGARLIASTTPGHGHLYLDTPLTWEQYLRLLDVLVELGLVEAGYVRASRTREATFVRPEWVRKPEAKPEPAEPDEEVVF